MYSSSGRLYGVQQYKELSLKVLNHGEVRPDRTGVGTISCFSEKMSFNLLLGYPVETTKRVAVYTAIKENLWMLSGSSYNEDLAKQGVYIWNEWQSCHAKWEDQSRRSVWIKKRIRPYQDTEYCGDFSYANLNLCVDSIDYKLANTWQKMMHRCYKKDNDNYKWYGGDGVTVCKSWHDPLSFIDDVKRIINWNLKKDNWNDYQIDKDYFGSNIYSPDTTIWLNQLENLAYIGKPVLVTDDNGIATEYITLEEASVSLDLPKTTLHRWILDAVSEKCDLKYRKYLKYNFKYLDKEGYVLRKEIKNGDLGPVYGAQWRHWPTHDGKEVDQIALLVDGLKNKPFSRRHIINAWNWAFIPDESISPQENVEKGNMCLPPCHIMAQWYVSKATDADKYNYICYLLNSGVSESEIGTVPEYKLDCQMYQRSADICLGVPFNILGYSTLTMMLAKQCGCMPGVYNHIIGDAHIYLNHVDKLKMQLTREPYPLPYLRIRDGVESIFDYRIEDFELVNYKHHDSISFDVAV